MRIAFAAEVCSFDLMQQVKEHLIEQGHEIIDLGMKSKEVPDVFYNTAPRVAAAVVDGSAERGILACGTGMGVCLCANKFKGIYAGVAESATTARLHYVINRANVLCLGAWVVGRLQALDIVDAYLSAEIGAGMPEERRRVQAEGFAKIQQYESKNFK
ncbi:MAG: RpiB/LacA/LacB family sugar-phosphate isomerase [Armatimonadetes bacterium]|nr:RpiB/LacA/LacB family sugar-phosphate isomerase [Armatimonadota bacterium]